MCVLNEDEWGAGNSVARHFFTFVRGDNWVADTKNKREVLKGAFPTPSWRYPLISFKTPAFPIWHIKIRSNFRGRGGLQTWEIQIFPVDRKAQTRGERRCQICLQIT